jgi:hypothetical protein
LWQTPDYSDGLANNDQGTYLNFVPTTNPNPTVPYPMPQNYVIYENYPGVDTTTVPIRRNLWYTFVLQGPGMCYVSVYPKTATQNQNYPFNVFESDVDGTLSFAAVVAGGHVDSTTAQGLTRVAYSSTPWCGNYQTVSFGKSDCGAKRYYVVVDHHALLELNNQIEVGVRFNGLPGTVKYDHFKEFATGHDGPNVINGLNQTAAPYTSVVLNGGTYLGAQASFNCATKHPTDQNSCGNTTLWYKIEVGISGKIRLNFDATDGTNTYTHIFNYGAPLYINNGNENMKLYRALTTNPPNYDAGPSVLEHVPLTATYEYNYSTYQYDYWGESCITPGTYYIMMTGCSFNGAWSVTPRVNLINYDGDFCTTAVPMAIHHVGTASATATVDCHTIGTDYGENGAGGMGLSLIHI